MTGNALHDKSLLFAVRTVKFCKYLSDTKREFVPSKQILRSGTSIGANLSEATCAMSDKDFLAKNYIAFKECAETQYWLELLFETEYLSEQEYHSISSDCDEIKRLLSSIY